MSSEVYKAAVEALNYQYNQMLDYPRYGATDFKRACEPILIMVVKLCTVKESKVISEYYKELQRAFKEIKQRERMLKVRR